MLDHMLQHVGKGLTLKQSRQGTFIIGGGWPGLYDRTATGNAPLPRLDRRATAWVAARTVPEIAKAQLVRAWGGMGSGSIDGLPIVGESSVVRGFHVAYVPLGFTMGPIVGQIFSEKFLTGEASRAARALMLPIDSWTAPHEPHRSSRSRHHRRRPRRAHRSDRSAQGRRRIRLSFSMRASHPVARSSAATAPAFRSPIAHAAGHEYSDGHALIAEARASGADIRSSTVVWGVWDKQLAFVSDEYDVRNDRRQGHHHRDRRARPRRWPFRAGRMPGVITAGAAKTLVAIQRVLPGKRILMAGSGPLALAFSAQLREYGANIVEVAEAAPRPEPIDFVRLALHGDPVDADGCCTLSRTAHAGSRSVLVFDDHRARRRTTRGRARRDREGRPRLARDPGTERSIEVDTVLLGYGLESNSEMSRLLDCEQVFDRTGGGWLPVETTRMRTSVPGIYAAGDGGGVGGSHSALQQGRIAGIAAATELGVVSEREATARLAEPMRRLARINRFAQTLNRIYAVGSGLYELATDDTLVCRCEERTQGELDLLVAGNATDLNVVRALSRIGMGRCQGRNCASHVAATIARKTGRDISAVAPPTARPPVKPVPVGAIAAERHQHDAEVQLS